MIQNAGKTIADVKYQVRKLARRCVFAVSAAVLFGDCQDFRVWPGIMGNKESHYVTTQRTCHTE